MGRVSKTYALKTAKSRISGKDRDANLRMPIVLAMACSLSRLGTNEIKDLYEAYKMPNLDINHDMGILCEQGIMEKECFGLFYFSGKSYAITIGVFTEVLKAADSHALEQAIDVLQRLKSGKWASRNVDSWNFTLARAMWKYLHNEPFADGIEECRGFLIADLHKGRSRIFSLITGLAKMKDWRGFILTLPEISLNDLRNLYIDDVLDLKTDYSDDTFHYLFFDDEECPYHDLMCIEYVIAIELFPNGHIDDLIGKYASSPANKDTKLAEYLRAVKSLHEGNPEPMIEVTLSLTMPGDTLFSVPEIAFFALIAALMQHTPETVKRFKAILKGVEKHMAPLMYGVLEWITKNKISDATFKRLGASSYQPSTPLLFSYFIIKCDMGLADNRLKAMAAEYAELVKNGPFEYLKLLFATLQPKQDLARQKLEKINGMKGLFAENASANTEKWEQDLTMLNRLLNAMSSPAGPAKQTKERIAYLIEDSRSIRPVLQKSADGGLTWTKGRSILMQSLKRGNVKCMTPQDMAVASKIVSQRTEYWGRETSLLYFHQAIPELIGHPAIFTDDDMRLKVEVSELPLQISVTTQPGGGYRIDTNMPGITSAGVYINTSNPLSITVTEVSEKQACILAALKGINKLPEQAKGQLSEALGKMSQMMTVMSDVGTAGTNEKKMKASKLITVQLIPDGDRINANLFVKPLNPAPPYLTPGKGTEFVNGTIDGIPTQARRDLQGEAANLREVEAMFGGMDDAMTGSLSWQLDIEQTLTVLEGLAANPEAGVAEWPEGVKMRINRPQLHSSALGLTVSASGGWFDLQGELKIDETRVLSMAKLLEKMRNNPGRFIQLEGDEYIALTAHLAETLRTLSQLAETSGKKNRIASFSADFLSDLEKEGVEMRRDKRAEALISQIRDANNAVIRIPSAIQADLRDYQKDGYRWMARLSLWGAGACLADDMGLGKTLQTICLLYADRAKGPSLVVAPTSLLCNWRDEVKRFAPSLDLTILNEYNDAARRAEIINSAKAGDIVVCSYGLLVNEQETLKAKEWNVAVLDEAHTIKNRDTKMSQAAMTLNARMRVALTGTPLQNRLAEIWNIFRFLNPGLLGSFQSFTDRFVTPIERDHDRLRQRLLKRLISPFLLRRTKSDVLNELPPKTEIVVRTELSDEERVLYETLRRQAELSVTAPDSSPVAALAEITRLRLAACNARLVNTSINIASSKMSEFMDIVGNLHSNHHRALVFSQFTSHLALVRERLEEAGIDYLYLDGSTPPAQRASLVREFQQGDVPLFLISLKAGGLGLNLTGADYVVHLDPWWNPAIENQATDRSHRIGQEKPVTVYRIIAADTIEERILELHNHKKSLADALLEGSDMSARLTKEEILSLLKE